MTTGKTETIGKTKTTETTGKTEIIATTTTMTTEITTENNHWPKKQGAAVSAALTFICSPWYNKIKFFQGGRFHGKKKIR